MEITDLETIPIELPVKTRDEAFGVGPYVGGNRLRNMPESLTYEEALAENEVATEGARKLLVRLTVDDDVTGWGEIRVPSMRVGQTIVEEVLEPAVLGRSVDRIEEFVDEFGSYSTLYYTDITPYVGAVEMAMWDALGKYHGSPVHELIGGKCRDSVPVSYCLGLQTTEESRRHARFARDHGFDVLKTKASRYWQSDVERIEAMHDEVDGDLQFRLDPNQLWSFENAVRVGAKLEDAGIYLQYMEQPIRVDTFDTLTRLRQRLQTPIAVNEDAYFQHSLSMIAARGAVDVAVVDLVPAGGILGLRKLAAVAGDFGISLAHHSSFDTGIKNAAKLHAIATIPEFSLPSDSVYYAYEDYLLEEPLEIEDGRMQVPDRPGLTGAVDESVVERYRIR